MKSERIFLIAVLLSMFVWGMSWSSAKMLSVYGSPEAIAFIRFSCTSLALLPIMYFTKNSIKGYGYVFGAGFFMFLYALCFFKGVQVGLPGAGGVLVTTMNPLFAFIVGLVISKIVPRKIELLGIAIGVIAGVFLLKVWTRSDAIFSFGNSYFLVGAFVWSIMSKFASQANRFGNAISFNFWLHLVSLVGLGILVDFQEVIAILENADTKFSWNMLYFSVINSAMATTCYLFATAKIGAEKASTYIFIVPSAAAIGAWIFHGEVILWHTVVGGFLGILAVFIINRNQKINT